MANRTNFTISDNVYLNHAKYYFALDSGIMVAAYLDKILIGLCSYDAHGQLYFTKKTIIIPSSNFVEFVKVLKIAYNSLKNNSEEAFEDLIYHHKPVHFLMGKYHFYEGNSACFTSENMLLTKIFFISCKLTQNVPLWKLLN